MHFEQIFMLTLKRQMYRRCELIGSLSALDYQVEKLSIFNGNDLDSYGPSGFIEDAVRDGFEIFRKIHPDTGMAMYHGIILWNHLTMLRRIANGDAVVLVLEDDMFPRLRYRTLLQKLAELSGLVSTPPEVVMLGYGPPVGGKIEATLVEGTDGFWARGALGPCQSANLYTPLGAKRVLDYYADLTNEIVSVEHLLVSTFRDAEFLYSSVGQLRKQTVLQGDSVYVRHENEAPHFCASDERHTQTNLSILERYGIDEPYFRR